LFDICIVNPTLEHTDKKEHIITVAEKLFSEQDFDSVSVRDLAKEANVNVAMISYYFGSKEKLFEALITSRIEASFGGLKEIVAQNKPFLEKMYDVIDFYMDKFTNHTAYQKIINREMSIDTRPHFRNLIIEKIKRNKQITKAMFVEEIEKGNISPDVDIEMTMMSFFATMYQINGAPHFSCQILEKKRVVDLHTIEFQDRIRSYFKEIIKKQLSTNQ